MITTQPVNTETVIKRALSFSMDEVLKRYAKDEGLPWEAVLEHERELKRYLALCALNPGKHYGMLGPIDDLWHTFILFTKEYAEFCNRVAGHFVHHVPSTSERRDGDLRGYEEFLADYEVVFGETTPAHLWPRIVPGGECDQSCGGCSKCSRCGKCGADASYQVNCKGCSSCNSCAPQ